MAKDDDFFEEKIDDEIDLLNFDLDDLSEEDTTQDITGPDFSKEDSDDDEIIDLLDMVESDSMAGDVGIEGSDQPLVGGDTVVEDNPIDLADLSIEVETPDVTKSPEPTEMDLDISSLELGSDVLADETPSLAAETGEIDVSESDLEKMLQEDTSLELEEDLSGTMETDANFDDLMKDADLEESFTIDTTDLKVEMGEEDITESDLEKLLGDQPQGESGETIEPPAEMETPVQLVEEPTIKMEAEIPEEEPMEEPSAREMEIEAPEEAAAGQPPIVAAPLLSEDRIEHLVADVVGRVTRETITDVTEKVVQKTVTEVVERLVRETLENVVERTVRETVSNVIEGAVRETISDVTERVARESMSNIAERIARETMVDVAGKVISEAIEALKRSLEIVTD
ncbi:MAG: hypothetical protein JW932_17105 [Deltaproteobacteria bacterium]|nr:hypothetical protein [Deltaproteobacteria bacterium]